MDAVAFLRLTWEIERDEAIPAREKALAQAEMFRRRMKAVIWMAREHFERMDPVRWRSFIDDFRHESEKLAGPHTGAIRRR
jgi:hypothetical protein